MSTIICRNFADATRSSVMNYAGGRNYLLIESGCDRSGGVHEGLFKISQEYAESSKSSWFLSLKEVGRLPGVGADTDKSILKRIVFMTFPDLDQMIAKVLQLRSWAVPPHLIVVDGSGLTQEAPEKICLMTAALLNLARGFSRRLNVPCASVLVLSQDVVPERLRQVVIDLYYYKTTFCDPEELWQCLRSPA